MSEFSELLNALICPAWTQEFVAYLRRPSILKEILDSEYSDLVEWPDPMRLELYLKNLFLTRL